MSLLLEAFAIVILAAAADDCASCTNATVFSSDSLRPIVVTSTPGEDVIWVVAEETGSSRVRILQIDPSVGAYITIAEFFGEAIHHLEADRDALYVMTTTLGSTHTSLVRIRKVDGSKQTLATDIRAVRDIQVDESHVYWIDAFSGLWRVSTEGGAPETIFPGAVHSFTQDREHVFFAAVESGGYNVYSMRKSDLALRYLTWVPTAQDLATEGQWLYVAIGGRIDRLAKTGGNVQTFSRITPTRPGIDYSGVRDMAMINGRAYVRQFNAWPRGCRNETLATYSAGDRQQVLSERGGDFVVTSCSVFHVPTDCNFLNLNPPRPPFTIERFCVKDVDQRRRVVRR